APRVAAEEPPRRLQRSPDEAVLAECVEGVLRAGRVVLARPGRHEAAEREAVSVDEPDPDVPHGNRLGVSPAARCTLALAPRTARSPARLLAHSPAPLPEPVEAARLDRLGKPRPCDQHVVLAGRNPLEH